MRKLFRKKIVWAFLALAVIAFAVGMWAFQPWKLFTHSTINEALPVAASPSTSSIDLPVSSTPSTTPPTTQPSPYALAAGDFVTQEHKTKGQAKVLRLADDSRVLRLENFSTSDGPDLHVWLSAASAGGDWRKYDDGKVVKLGKMKATDGNQNYIIPADADLSGLQSVVIWCDRFNVAFGSAPLMLS